MLRSALFLFLLAAPLARAQSASPVQLAAPALAGVGLPEATLSFYGEHLGQQMNFAGIRVVTAREISTLLGLERQRQLTGCADASACITELANALGSDGVLVGDVGKFGSRVQINLKVLAAADARQLAAYSTRVDSEEAVLDALSLAARVLARETYRKLGRPVPQALEQHAAAEGEGLRSYAYLPALGGGLALAGGVALIVLSGAEHRALTEPGPPLSDAEARQLRDAGKLKQGAGAVAVTVGAAALVTAGAMYLLGAPPDAPQISLLPARDGAGFALSGALP